MNNTAYGRKKLSQSGLEAVRELAAVRGDPAS